MNFILNKNYEIYIKKNRRKINLKKSLNNINIYSCTGSCIQCLY